MIKDIKFPLRIGFNSPSLKDADNRVIIQPPLWMIKGGEVDEERLEQWLADLETILELCNKNHV